jgi:hypothetical protein
MKRPLVTRKQNKWQNYCIVFPIFSILTEKQQFSNWIETDISIICSPNFVTLFLIVNNVLWCLDFEIFSHCFSCITAVVIIAIVVLLLLTVIKQRIEWQFCRGGEGFGKSCYQEDSCWRRVRVENRWPSLYNKHQITCHSIVRIHITKAQLISAP